MTGRMNGTIYFLTTGSSLQFKGKVKVRFMVKVRVRIKIMVRVKDYG
jgi:hypothetical protein